MRFRMYTAIVSGDEGYSARVVYISDEEVVGRVEQDDDRGIVLRVPVILTRGEVVDEPQAIKAIRDADVVVLYGRRIVRLAVELGFAAEDSILDVNGLQHVQIFKFKY